VGESGDRLRLLALYSALCFWIFSSSIRDWEKSGATGGVLERWMATIGISAVSLVLSTVFGVSAALARRSAFLPLKYTRFLCRDNVVLPLVYVHGLSKAEPSGARTT